MPFVAAWSRALIRVSSLCPTRPGGTWGSDLLKSPVNSFNTFAAAVSTLRTCTRPSCPGFPNPPLWDRYSLALNTSNPNSPTGLGVAGAFDAVAAGILVYMALVDLVAVDFMSARFRADTRLQAAGYGGLVLGALAMSVLAVWA